MTEEKNRRRLRLAPSTRERISIGLNTLPSEVVERIVSMSPIHRVKSACVLISIEAEADDGSTIKIISTPTDSIIARNDSTVESTVEPCTAVPESGTLLELSRQAFCNACTSFGKAIDVPNTYESGPVFRTHHEPQASLELRSGGTCGYL